MNLLKQSALYVFLGLLAYMPLHILLSTWIGTSFGVLDFAKVFKDIVLALGFLAAVAVSVKQPWFKRFIKDRLVWLVVGYGLLTAGLALVRPTDQDAEILGVVYNTRFLVFFLYGVLLSKLFDAKKLQRIALVVVVGVASFVALFGIVQYAALPDDALTRVGYARENGVLPAFFIDDKPDLERAMSTLRDPNSFGSYLIIIGSIALGFYFLNKQKQARRTAAWLLALSVLALWYTFSRSAWLGFSLAATAAVLISQRHRLKTVQTKKALLISLVVLVAGLAALYPLRNTYFVQNVVFHADEATVLEDPNQLRARFLRESVEDIAANPLGSGPGTAGLASIRNDVQGTALNENYYLQVAQEVGILGLMLFLAILSTAGKRLYGLAKSNPLALGVFAAFIGLAATNLFVHIWSNEAVAYTWWGLVGMISWCDRRRDEYNKSNKNAATK